MTLSSPEESSHQVFRGSTASSSATSATCQFGKAGNYPCENVDLLGHLSIAALAGDNPLGNERGNDVWGWTSPNGREFALMGLTTGTVFVEVTQPENPVLIGSLPTASTASSWRDMKVYGNYAFIVSEASGHGMQVFDLTELLQTPAGTSQPRIFSATAHYQKISNAHNIVINTDSGFAYLVGTNTCRGGLHMVDITDPMKPKQAGCFGDDGYVHDAQCVIYQGPHVAYQGREICFCSSVDTVTIVDVTNKQAPLLISATRYPQSGYTHQGWLSADHSFFLFGDETDELNFSFATKTLVLNVETLTSPTLAGFYTGPTAAIDHNLYTTANNHVYLSNYEAGVRILRMDDLSDASLTEVAYFDTHIGGNRALFHGVWSLYPYLPSGTLLVSDIDNGLFLLRPNLPPQGESISPTQAPSPSIKGEDDKDICPDTSNLMVSYHKSRKKTKTKTWKCKRIGMISKAKKQRKLCKKKLVVPLGNQKTVADVCLQECAAWSKGCTSSP